MFPSRWLTAIALCGGLAAAGLADEPRALWEPKPANWRSALAFVGQSADDGQGPNIAAEPLPPGGRTLQELEAIALSNHPTLLEAAAEVAAARGRWVQSGLYPNPMAAYVGEEMGNADQSGMQGISLSQEIVTANRLGLDRQVAAWEIRQAQQQWVAKQNRVINDVRIAFYDVLVAERLVEVSKQLVHVGEEGVKAAEALLGAMEVSRVDLLQARVEANTAKILLANAENRYQAAWRKLVAVVAVPQMQPVPLVGDASDDLPRLQWDEALARLLSESPELGVAQARINRASWALRRAGVEVIPNVAVNTAVQHDNATGDDFATLQFGFRLPIFDRNQGAIRAAQAELTAARANYSRVELALHRRLAEVFERYENTRQQTERYSQNILPDAQASLELVADGYRQGQFNYTTLLTAQRTFFHTSLAYLESLIELRRSGVEIEGLLLTGSLE